MQGLLVPADPEKPIERIAGDFRTDLKKLAKLDFVTRINTRQSQDNGFIGLVEDDGRQLQLRRNYRAQWLLGYGLDGEISAFLVGPALLISEAWVDDGMDIVGLKPDADKWIMDPARFGDDFTLFLHSGKARAQSMHYDGGAIGGFGHADYLEAREARRR